MHVSDIIIASADALECNGRIITFRDDCMDNGTISGESTDAQPGQGSNATPLGGETDVATSRHQLKDHAPFSNETIVVSSGHQLADYAQLSKETDVATSRHRLTDHAHFSKETDPRFNEVFASLNDPNEVASRLLDVREITGPQLGRRKSVEQRTHNDQLNGRIPSRNKPTYSPEEAPARLFDNDNGEGIQNILCPTEPLVPHGNTGCYREEVCRDNQPLKMQKKLFLEGILEHKGGDSQNIRTSLKSTDTQKRKNPRSRNSSPVRRNISSTHRKEPTSDQRAGPSRLPETRREHSEEDRLKRKWREERMRCQNSPTRDLRNSLESSQYQTPTCGYSDDSDSYHEDMRLLLLRMEAKRRRSSRQNCPRERLTSIERDLAFAPSRSLTVENRKDQRNNRGLSGYSEVDISAHVRERHNTKTSQNDVSGYTRKTASSQREVHEHATKSIASISDPRPDRGHRSKGPSSKLDNGQKNPRDSWKSWISSHLNDPISICSRAEGEKNLNPGHWQCPEVEAVTVKSTKLEIDEVTAREHSIREHTDPGLQDDRITNNSEEEGTIKESPAFHDMDMDDVVFAPHESTENNAVLMGNDLCRTQYSNETSMKSPNVVSREYRTPPRIDIYRTGRSIYSHIDDKILTRCSANDPRAVLGLSEKHNFKVLAGNDSTERQTTESPTVAEVPGWSDIKRLATLTDKLYEENARKRMSYHKAPNDGKSLDKTEFYEAQSFTNSSSLPDKSFQIEAHSPAKMDAFSGSTVHSRLVKQQAMDILVELCNIVSQLSSHSPQ